MPRRGSKAPVTRLNTILLIFYHSYQESEDDDFLVDDDDEEEVLSEPEVMWRSHKHEN